jgi:hypothetical protein
VPEIPKKKVPEEKRPIPLKEEEAPPPKGIVILSFREPAFCNNAAKQMMMLSVV